MGVGYHISETLPNIFLIVKLTISYATIYTVCISAVKLSVLFFYLRTFVNKGMQLATKIVIGLICVWSSASILSLFLSCRPFPKYLSGTCADEVSAFIAIGAYNIVSDFIVLTLPLRTIWTLNTRKQMKISLSIVFLAGLIVSAVAVCRIFTLTSLQLDDVTGTMMWVDFLSTLEVNLAIICVSIPMLGPYLARYKKTRGASKLDRYGGSGQSELRISKRAKKPGPDTLALESIYDHNDDTHRVVVASAANTQKEIWRQDRSETYLNLARQASVDRRGAGAIMVENKWEIEHS